MEYDVNQEWFEMKDIRRKTLQNTVWIPLKALNTISTEGQNGFVGFKIDFYFLETVAIPVLQKESLNSLKWDDTGRSIRSKGYYDDETNKYIAANIFQKDEHGIEGIRLVLEQRINSKEPTEWHLEQDFVLTMELKREGDVWVAPNEGYIEVVKLHRRDGFPVLIEVRAEHLKDYLCARNMGLYVSSFYNRECIIEQCSSINWSKEVVKEVSEWKKWEGRITEIHEGGDLYGSSIASFHVSRNDIDGSEDIPVMSAEPNDENTNLKSWSGTYNGRKLYMISGKLWSREWVEPGKISPRIKDDESPTTAFFIVDENGKKEGKDTLIDSGRWLWFNPSVINELISKRGGLLDWYTKDTGIVGCSPDDEVNFGMNALGLINVYAEDIAQLPDWQQQIWSGFTVSPDGKLSEELFLAQVKGQPARTTAPETALRKAIETVNEIAKRKWNFTIFKEHDILPEVFAKTHRFRAVDNSNIYALAKDLARLTADSLNSTEIQKVAPPKDKKTLGSLKSLELLLSLKVGDEKARDIIAPLFGVYDLRLADAHLPSSKTENAFKHVNVDRYLPTVLQGCQIILSVVTCLNNIIQILKSWDEG